MKKKVLCFTVAGMVVLGLLIAFQFHNPQKALAAEVKKNFTKISELGLAQITSSNPYNYIDNEYYENIVGLGVPALEIINEMYENDELDGLSSYVAALAVQEITGINLHESTGNDWETSQGFFDEWKPRFEEIMSYYESMTTDER